MVKTKTAGKKFLLAAGVLLSIALGVKQPVQASQVTTPVSKPSAAVKFNPQKDWLTVLTADKSKGFEYYTTTKPSTKSAPSPDKWFKTVDVDADGKVGDVDVSYIPTEKNIYFANTTSPALDEIVTVVLPASPKITSVTFAPVQEKMEDKLVFYATVKYLNGTKYKSDKVRLDHSMVEVRTNDNQPWTPLSNALTPQVIERMMPMGATIYARIVPSNKAGTVSTEIAGVEVKEGEQYTGVFQFETESTVKLCDKASSQTPYAQLANVQKSTFVRFGVAKAFKITKAPTAPAVSFDYANHTMKLKSGMSYVQTAKFGEVSETEKAAETWKNKLTTTQVVSLGDSAASFAVKKAATTKVVDSVITYAGVKDAKKFVETNSLVQIAGGKDQNATLLIRYTPEKQEGAIKPPSVLASYQYTAVTEEVLKSCFDTNGNVDYGKLAAVKWSTAKTKTVKGQAYGEVKVTLTASKILKDKQYVLVRKAADTSAKEFSSQIVILKRPDDKVSYWQMLAREDYKNGTTLGFENNGKVQKCMDITMKHVSGTDFEIELIGDTGAKLLKEMLTQIKVKVKVKSSSSYGTVSVVGTPTDTKATIHVESKKQGDEASFIFTLPNGLATSATSASVGVDVQLDGIDNKPATVEKIETSNKQVFTGVLTGEFPTDFKIADAYSKFDFVVGTTTYSFGATAAANVAKLEFDKNTFTITLEKPVDTSLASMVAIFRTKSDAQLKDSKGNNVAFEVKLTLKKG